MMWHLKITFMSVSCFLKSHGVILKAHIFLFFLSFISVYQVLWLLTYPKKVKHDFSHFQDLPLVLDLCSCSRHILNTSADAVHSWY